MAGLGSRVNVAGLARLGANYGHWLVLGRGGEEKERKRWVAGLRSGKEKGGGGLGRLGFCPHGLYREQ
jgi:hypothetical protein